jgi:O-antigen ligase
MLRALTRWLVIIYVFTVPWEYSVDLGEPWGNIARIIGLVVLAIAVLAALESGKLRRWQSLQWMVLLFIVYWALSAMWSLDSTTTIEKLRAFLQTTVMALVIWEFDSEPDDLRNLLRAVTAGSLVLAVLTILNFTSPEAYVAGQLRYAAVGQDPNDVARFLALGFPLAACSFRLEKAEFWRWPGICYLPIGLLAVLLTASRGGAVAATCALLGAAVVIFYGHAKRAFLSVPIFAASALALFALVPDGSLARLATLRDELLFGSLNGRVEIWSRGFEAFKNAPWLGEGAGTFVLAAHTANEDTAHNTPLTMLVTGGLLGFSISLAIGWFALRAAIKNRGFIRIAMVTALFTLMLSSLVGTIEENRITWIVIAIISTTSRHGLRESEREPAPSLSDA